MKNTASLLVLTVVIFTTTTSHAIAGKKSSDYLTNTIRLWPNLLSDAKPTVLPEQPNNPATRVTNITSPTLHIHRAADTQESTPAVLVCPGGGYGYVVVDKEGTEIAQWLNSLGITAAVLHYRTPDNRSGALQDAQRAMKLIRQNAKSWNIDPRRVGAIGFSAGGHLVVKLSTSGDRPTYEKIDDADGLPSRPDFTIAIYPAYLADKDGKLAEDINVTAETPPAFIVQTQDDHSYVDSSAAYFQALSAAKVPAELHIFQTGGHGYGLRKSKNAVSGWPKLCEQWLKASEIIVKP